MFFSLRPSSVSLFVMETWRYSSQLCHEKPYGSSSDRLSQVPSTTVTNGCYVFGSTDSFCNGILPSTKPLWLEALISFRAHPGTVHRLFSQRWDQCTVHTGAPQDEMNPSLHTLHNFVLSTTPWKKLRVSKMAGNCLIHRHNLHEHVCTYRYENIHTSLMHAHIYSWYACRLCICVYDACVHEDVYSYTCICIHICTYVHACMHINACTRIRKKRQMYLFVCERGLLSYTCSCMYAMYVYVYIHACMPI